MPWEIMPDLLFYRDPKAVVKEENKRAENEQVIKSGSDLSAPPQRKSGEDWSANSQPAATMWPRTGLPAQRH